MIGTKTLKEMKSVINIVTNTLQLDEREIVIPKKSKKVYPTISKEDELLAKKCTTMAIKSQNKLEKLVEIHMKSNPSLGIIPNTEHKIKLKGEVSYKNKRYTVPLNYKNKTEQEIARLLELKIIKSQKPHIQVLHFQ